MKHFTIFLAAVFLLARCGNRTEDRSGPAANGGAQPAQSTTSAPPDISTPALIKHDPDVQKYDAAVSVALKADDAMHTPASKVALVKAYIDFADYLTYDSPLPPRLKYRRALAEYRKAAELDPNNEKARKEIAQIEDIYRSMGRPVPGEE